jgi:hypothetical protein
VISLAGRGGFPHQSAIRQVEARGRDLDDGHLDALKQPVPKVGEPRSRSSTQIPLRRASRHSLARRDARGTACYS